MGQAQEQIRVRSGNQLCIRRERSAGSWPGEMRRATASTVGVRHGQQHWGWLRWCFGQGLNRTGAQYKTWQHLYTTTTFACRQGNFWIFIFTSLLVLFSNIPLVNIFFKNLCMYGYILGFFSVYEYIFSIIKSSFLCIKVFHWKWTYWKKNRSANLYMQKTKTV